MADTDPEAINFFPKNKTPGCIFCKEVSNNSYGFTNPSNVRICADPPTHP